MNRFKQNTKVGTFRNGMIKGVIFRDNQKGSSKHPMLVLFDVDVRWEYDGEERSVVRAVPVSRMLKHPYPLSAEYKAALENFVVGKRMTLHHVTELDTGKRYWVADDDMLKDLVADFKSYYKEA